jgi:hypothetical protein
MAIFFVHISLFKIIGFHKANKIKIKIDKNIAITPNNLFGIDLKIA